MSSDRQRLARVFGFEAMRPWGALAGSAALIAAIPWGTWVIGGPLALAVVAMVADENYKIAKGLREVETWGFPVTGYREWLLANSPAFDLELKREVALDVIEGSLRAVDPSIVAERRGERIVRVVMRRIEHEGSQNQETVLVGDRTRLREVRDRVLGPLHADVGIAAMRMGDYSTLAALVAGATSVTRGSAFREQALAAPPDLQSLAHAGTAHLAPPQEADTLKLRTDRLLYATGHVPTSSSRMTWTLLGTTILGGIVDGFMVGTGIGLVIGAGVGAVAAWSMRRTDRKALDESLHEIRAFPFPMTGLENWLLSGRPQFDVELDPGVDVEAVARELGLVSQRLTLTWLSDHVVRVETEPTIHMAAEGLKSFWGGDVDLLRAVLGRLSQSVRIRAVRMGGYLDRRA